MRMAGIRMPTVTTVLTAIGLAKQLNWSPVTSSHSLGQVTINNNGFRGTRVHDEDIVICFLLCSRVAYCELILLYLPNHLKFNCVIF